MIVVNTGILGIWKGNQHTKINNVELSPLKQLGKLCFIYNRSLFILLNL